MDGKYEFKLRSDSIEDQKLKEKMIDTFNYLLFWKHLQSKKLIYFEWPTVRTDAPFFRNFNPILVYYLCVCLSFQIIIKTFPILFLLLHVILDCFIVPVTCSMYSCSRSSILKINRKIISSFSFCRPTPFSFLFFWYKFYLLSDNIEFFEFGLTEGFGRLNRLHGRRLERDFCG